MRGFKGFRKPETIAQDALEAALKRMGLENRYVYWTGNSYNFRKESLRSQTLRLIKTKGRPVSMKDWVKKAARCVSDTQGFNPERVRDGLYLHRNSKPAVYFELVKDAKGNYVLADNIPFPDEQAFPKAKYPKGLKAGQIIVPATAKAEGEAAKPAKGKAAKPQTAAKAQPEVKKPEPAKEPEGPKAPAEKPSFSPIGQMGTGPL